MITIETIDGYLRSRDWRFLKRKDNIWQTGFRGIIRNYAKNFEIFIHLDEDWVYLQTPILIGINEDCKVSLYEYLLKLNYQCFLAKFCLEKGRVILVVELPRSSSNAELNDAVWALFEYSNRFFLEIFTIALDRNISSLWYNSQTKESQQTVNADEEETPEIIFN
jgi:hypothetical protein